MKAKLENFWYYHRLHVLALAAVLICAAILFADCRSVSDPDWSVGFLLRSSLPDGAETAAAEALENVLPDRNGDGKPVVERNTYLIGSGPDSVLADRISGITRLTADLQSFRCWLFLTDEPASFQNEMNLFASDADLGLSGGRNPAGRRWSACPLLSSRPLPEGSPDLFLALRWTDPEALTESQLDGYTQARDLFLLLTGEAGK